MDRKINGATDSIRNNTDDQTLCSTADRITEAFNSCFEDANFYDEWILLASEGLLNALTGLTNKIIIELEVNGKEIWERRRISMLKLLEELGFTSSVPFVTRSECEASIEKHSKKEVLPAFSMRSPALPGVVVSIINSDRNPNRTAVVFHIENTDQSSRESVSQVTH